MLFALWKDGLAQAKYPVAQSWEGRENAREEFI
jgi:hypothetical protein